jgi:hypothetical protein
MWAQKSVCGMITLTYNDWLQVFNASIILIEVLASPAAGGA